MARDCLNFIDGAERAPASGRWLDNLEPATGAVLGRVADSGPEDVARAVAAARAAQADWAALPTAERAGLLRELARHIGEQAESLARLESADTGKPLALARNVDMARARANLEFFAGAVEHWSGQSHDMGAAGFNYTRSHPLGVVACITPWNLPLYLLTWKIGPALAAGNAVVAKPSEMTPSSASALAQLALEAGFPPGVLNIVHGAGATAGQALVDHPDVQGISFTGGTVTGRRLASEAAGRLQRLSLELGGRNPAVVFEDVDPAQVADGLVRAGFTNQGQVCLCSSRILIHENAYEAVREALVERVQALKPGDPLDETTDQGALISAAHLEKVSGYIDQARADGGRILCGGRRTSPGGRCEKGWFLEPAVIEGLPEDSRVLSEEIFGPVVTLQSFSTGGQAIERANLTPYGLAATVWTGDLDRAHRVAGAIQAGIVWVNGWLVRDLRTPFGGMKASGIGREGGFRSLEFFTETQNVCIVHNP